MRAAKEPVCPGNSKHSPLSAAAKMLDIKCRHSGSVALVDDLTEFIQELLPEDNKMPKNFAEIKKIIRGLGLPVEVIDCCFRNCKIYWATAKHMTLHAEHDMVDGKICHPAFGQNYSSWPVILTPYNLPPGMCMKDEFMFLIVIVPGPRNPKHQMDIFLQPLIADLNQLWEFGVHTFDVHRRQNFQMKAALMWAINDFPAYSMLSGWSTSGRLACPHCMENKDAFTLKGSRKQSWFDCHKRFLPRGHPYRHNTTHFRKGKTVNQEFGQPKTGEELLAEVDNLGFMKAYEIGAEKNNDAKSIDYGWNKKSIFWDLPHWKTNLIRHNLDVMHIEKNVFDNIFNTAMYALDRDGKKALLEWIKLIKFPDGYASNFSRCVDTISLKMHGMKSHDCHIFMQRISPIALRELLPKEVWEPLIELSIFFRALTSTSLTEKDIERMRLEIPKILCKLERIFPPSFFDSMEHLPVHLPIEAMMAGPVQYRWIYLRKLKKRVSNKGRVEGSISSGYLNEETAKFAAYYFSEGDPMIPERLQRNEVCDIKIDDDVDRLSIFKPHGQSVGACRKRYLEDAEIVAARTYVLLNCSEIENYRDIFEGELRRGNPDISTSQIEAKFQSDFAYWFQQYVSILKIDFYGVLKDIIELEYPALPMKTTVLFKCEWFDPAHNSGTISNKKYNMVDINNRKRYNKYEPFILAEQADQVHCLPYPSKRRDKLNWWAVCRIKARSEFDMPEGIIPAFQDETEENPLIVATDGNPTYFADQNGEA
ncbi:uncharacterized protein LOC126672458 [Mercurialis annua]|uniref:uncharacterized protein LOC126672458 n=1 Tax=Mercurialis annua TaxID=3986 RepID=UPI00215F934B|nr:uncharacterized protein LOC126672458 [Mercurialis annua]